MYNSKMLFLILICGIFVFGCLGTPDNTEPKQEIPADTEQESVDEETVDLNGLSYTELVQLNTPLECDISIVVGNDNEFNVKMYSNGAGDVRFDYGTDYPLAMGCANTFQVLSGNYVSTGCEGKPAMAEIGCDYMKYELDANGDIDYESESDGNTVSYSQEITSAFAALPASAFVCKPWVYDASVFTPSGQGCTLEEFTEKVNEYYSN